MEFITPTQLEKVQALCASADFKHQNKRKDHKSYKFQFYSMSVFDVAYESLKQEGIPFESNEVTRYLNDFLHIVVRVPYDTKTEDIAPRRRLPFHKGDKVIAKVRSKIGLSNEFIHEGAQGVVLGVRGEDWQALIQWKNLIPRYKGDWMVSSHNMDDLRHA